MIISITWNIMYIELFRQFLLFSTINSYVYLLFFLFGTVLRPTFLISFFLVVRFFRIRPHKNLKNFLSFFTVTYTLSSSSTPVSSQSSRLALSGTFVYISKGSKWHAHYYRYCPKTRLLTTVDEIQKFPLRVTTHNFFDITFVNPHVTVQRPHI